MITLSSLVQTVIFVIIGGLIFGLLWYAIEAVKLREPFAQVARVVLILGAVFFLIAVLMGLAGHPLINFDK